MTGDYNAYLAVGAVLFVLGAIGFVTRRNLILMMLSAELMLHGVSLNLLAFGRMYGRMEGQAFTIFVLTVAACEAGLSLSIILSLYQRVQVARRGAVEQAEGTGRRRGRDHRRRAARRTSPTMYFPTLTAAGAMPSIDDDAPLAAEVAKAPQEGGRSATATEAADKTGAIVPQRRKARRIDSNESETATRMRSRHRERSTLRMRLA